MCFIPKDGSNTEKAKNVFPVFCVATVLMVNSFIFRRAKYHCRIFKTLMLQSKSEDLKKIPQAIGFHIGYKVANFTLNEHVITAVLWQSVYLLYTCRVIGTLSEVQQFSWLNRISENYYDDVLRLF